MKNKFKKIVLTILLSSSCMGLSNAATVGSTGGSVYLQLIWENTLAILKQINTFPAYVKDLSDMAKSWMKADDSTAMANGQALFSGLGATPIPDFSTINQLTQHFITRDTGAPLPTDVNDYSFSSLMGTNFYLQKPDPRASNSPPPNIFINYLKNASGANLPFATPVIGAVGGNSVAQATYKSLYNTFAAVQSYNNYLLNFFIATAEQDGAMNKLAHQATDANWLAQVGGEELGKVFREMLLYQAQTFVLLSRLVEMQERALGAQVMTNTLLLAVNQGGSQLLFQQAVGSH